MSDRRIVLASASPRRRELLAVVLPTFDVSPSEVPEPLYTAGVDPSQYTLDLASRKAIDVARRYGPEAITIAADTIVALNDRILHKPQDAQEALQMLRALAGQTHRVITGLCVMDGQTGELLRDCVETHVRMRAAAEGELTAYVATGEPMDKAGAYAIQGKAALFIEGISGCYFNAVGLPLYALGRILLKLGVRCI